MEKLIWSQKMSLGVPHLDQAHQEFVEALDRLSNAPDAEFAADFGVLIARMEIDFRAEETLMEDIDFPEIHSHREQHARVLSALHHVVPEVMRGDCQAARRVIDLIPHWFLFHVLTMDAALVSALQSAGKLSRLSA